MANLYSVQAKQFGRVMFSDVIKAQDREIAIKRFKKKNMILGQGYFITAQKVKRKFR